MAFELRIFGRELLRTGRPAAGQAPTIIRAFGDADTGRLYQDWRLDYGYTATETASELPRMRGRCRALVKDNPYAKKWLWLLVANIVGDEGMTLDVQSKDPKGGIDTVANRELERQFHLWGENPDWCDMAGRKNYIQHQQAAMRGIGRDGEYVIQMVSGVPGNPYSFALKAHRVDALDVTYNEQDTGRGTSILNGVEIDSWGRPVRYWFRKNGKAAYMPGGHMTGDRVAISADNIIHPFFEEQEDQTRGFPWLYSALRRLHMLEEYERSELAAARDCANSLGVYKRSSDPYGQDRDAIAGRDELEQSLRPSEPGAREVLPEGWDYTHNRPVRPNQAFPDFQKSMLRGVSAGGLVHYNTLSNDLEGVSYSSLRDGKLSERDMYKVMQAWFAAKFNRVIYRRWLLNYLSFHSGTSLPLEKYEKFAEHKWHGRRWPWVDPRNESAARETSRNHGWTTDRDIAQEMGHDYEQNIEQIKETQRSVKGTYLEASYENETDK